MGADLDAGDFDGDGFTDLAIGAPGDGATDTGGVNVLYGTSDGLGVDGNELSTAAGPAEPTDDGALSTAWAGDLDGDGLADLVVGAPGRYGVGYDDVGVVGLLHGSADGLTEGTTTWTGAPGDHFGGAATATDVDGDRCPELSVGAPQADRRGEDGRRKRQAGTVRVYAGTPQGPAADDAFGLTQATAGVPGPMRPLDQLGEFAP